MITKKGTIKAETMLNKQMFKEVFRPFMIISMICLIIGSVGLAADLVWTIIAALLETDGPHIVLLIAFAVAFAFGLIFVITFHVSAKKLSTGEMGEIREEYEFYTSYVEITDYAKGNNVGGAKLWYSQISKRRETKHYLCFYGDNKAMFCVTKATLTLEEADTVRSVIGLKTKGSSTHSLPQGEEQPQPATAPSPATSAAQPTTAEQSAPNTAQTAKPAGQPKANAAQPAATAAQPATDAGQTATPSAQQNNTENK